MNLATAAPKSTRETKDDDAQHVRAWVCPLNWPKGALVQWPLLRDFSYQLSRSRVEACLLLFFGQIPLRVFIGARCELVAFLKPFLRQPRKDKRKPWSIPCLRVAEYFRVVDRFRDVFLRIRHDRFSTHFLSIKARHATCFVEHLTGCL